VVFLDATDALDEQSLVECWSQSTSIMPNPTTNPKILDMPQDAKFRNQSKTHPNQQKNIDNCIIGYNIGCGFITSNS
jgi:hypothetical protein